LPFIAIANPKNKTAYDIHTERSIFAKNHTNNNEITTHVLVNIRRPYFFIFLPLPLDVGTVIKRPNEMTTRKKKKNTYDQYLSSRLDQAFAASLTAVVSCE